MSANNSPQRPNQARPFLNEDGTTYGNLDEKKQYSFPAGWIGSVVVTQYNVFNAPSGQTMIDEGSRRLMPYDKDVFTKLVNDRGFEDVQYIILNDPR